MKRFSLDARTAAEILFGSAYVDDHFDPEGPFASGADVCEWLAAHFGFTADDYRHLHAADRVGNGDPIATAIERIQAIRDDTGRTMIAEPVAQRIAQQLREDQRLQTPPGEYQDRFFDLVGAAQEAVALMTDAHLDELWEIVSDDYWEVADSEDHEAYDAAQGELSAFDRALDILTVLAYGLEPAQGKA